jgi:hypothetical protein
LATIDGQITSSARHWVVTLATRLPTISAAMRAVALPAGVAVRDRLPLTPPSVGANFRERAERPHMPLNAVVVLPESDRSELGRWLRAPSMPAGLTQRARIVLLALHLD